MAIPHANPGDLIDIRPLGEALKDARTTTLIKTDSLEVIRLILPAGKEIARHAVPGEITVQGLEGRISFRVRGSEFELSAGKLIYLHGDDEHSLQALEDASVLLTILLKRQP